jgi:hypothetical protein
MSQTDGCVVYSVAGIPLTNESTIAHLIRAGVTVGVGPQGTNAEPLLSGWAVRNQRFDAGWVSGFNSQTLRKS